MNKKLLALFGAIALAITACGSGDSSDDGLSSEAATTTAAPATETTTTAAPETETTEAETTEDTEAVEEAAASTISRQPLTLATATAGPITVTPTECAVEGAALEGPGGAESIAFAGDHLFVSNDAGVLAFSFTGGPDCVLTLDTTMGTNGVMTDDTNLSSLSGTVDGRLAASGVLGTMVFDTAQGFSYECNMTGYVSLSPDGSTALMNFPGRDAVEQWSLSDTNCDETGSMTFDGIPDVKFVTYDGSDFLVGGSNAAETVVVSRYRNGAPVWTAGSDDTGADDWWGWVHGMAPCGNFTCMIDTNTDALALIGDDGVVAAAFDFSDLIGIRSWIEPIVVGPDGAAYVLFDDAVDDETSDERTYFASIIRLDVTN
ncbi:MAG: hypothetical protein R2710_15270 [Acidimicrobiales bacterium]